MTAPLRAALYLSVSTARPGEACCASRGYGVHVCLGSMLARLEMRVGFEALAARIDDFALAGDEDRMPSNRLLGIRKLPITVKRKDHRS